MPSFKVRIYDDFVTFDFGGQLKSDGNNDRPKPYTGKVYDKGELEHDSNNTQYLLFKFPPSQLDDQKMLSMADFGGIGKNNSYGTLTFGVFEWAAGLLSEGGAKSKYGVKSPFVGKFWNSENLANYCSRIRIALGQQN